MLKTRNGKVTIKAESIGDMMNDYTILTKAIIKCFEDDGLSKELALRNVEEAINLAKCETAEEEFDYMAKRMLEVAEKVLKREEKENE